VQRSQAAEVTHQKGLDQLELSRAKELAQIESMKFQKTVAAIGVDTIASIAAAGPATQAKLLSGPGIQSMLITDGNSPINLFNTTQGLMGGANMGLPAPAN
jgi:major vault protein